MHHPPHAFFAGGVGLFSATSASSAAIVATLHQHACSRGVVGWGVGTFGVPLLLVLLEAHPGPVDALVREHSHQKHLCERPAKVLVDGELCAAVSAAAAGGGGATRTCDDVGFGGGGGGAAAAEYGRRAERRRVRAANMAGWGGWGGGGGVWGDVGGQGWLQASARRPVQPRAPPS